MPGAVELVPTSTPSMARLASRSWRPRHVGGRSCSRPARHLEGDRRRVTALDAADAHERLPGQRAPPALSWLPATPVPVAVSARDSPSMISSMAGSLGGTGSRRPRPARTVAPAASARSSSGPDVSVCSVVRRTARRRDGPGPGRSRLRCPRSPSPGGTSPAMSLGSATARCRALVQPGCRASAAVTSPPQDRNCAPWLRPPAPRRPGRPGSPRSGSPRRATPFTSMVAGEQRVSYARPLSPSYRTTSTPGEVGPRRTGDLDELAGVHAVVGVVDLVEEHGGAGIVLRCSGIHRVPGRYGAATGTPVNARMKTDRTTAMRRADMAPPVSSVSGRGGGAGCAVWGCVATVPTAALLPLTRPRGVKGGRRRPGRLRPCSSPPSPRDVRCGIKAR